MAVAVVLACGGGSDGPSYPNTPNTPNNPGTPNTPGTPGANQIEVGDGVFTPTALTVSVGATVTWNWSGGYYSAEHNVSFTNSTETSGNKTTGTFSRVFSAAGSYVFFCSIHGAPNGTGMAGTITVQ
jgi:plastocyanin